MGSLPRPSPRFSFFYCFAFFLLIAAFLAAGIAAIDNSCLDAADGAYLISGNAVAHGLFPYRDFLAAHPPAIYLLGGLLARLGKGVAPFRIFSLLLSAGLGLAVWRLALRITGKRAEALLAGTLAMFAPLGVYFSKLYLNDSMVALLTAATFFLLLGGSRRQTAAAGALSVTGMLTKLTYFPVLAAAVVFVLVWRRAQLRLFLGVAFIGVAVTALLLEAFTSGAYLADIIGAQASKGASFANFYEGMHRIWQMDWPLLVPAAGGLWFSISDLAGKKKDTAGHREGQALVLLWLAAGLASLATLPAEGHDTNLFQVAEPAIAILAATGLGRLARGRIALGPAVAVALMAVMFPAIAVKDRSFLTRSNASVTAAIVAEIDSAARPGDQVLAPGCPALEAGRPVADNFFDQFLWEEKFKRGDSDATKLFLGIAGEIGSGRLPAVAFQQGQPSQSIFLNQLQRHYYPVRFPDKVTPPLTLWLLKK